MCDFLSLEHLEVIDGLPTDLFQHFCALENMQVWEEEEGWGNGWSIDGTVRTQTAFIN